MLRSKSVLSALLALILASAGCSTADLKGQADILKGRAVEIAGQKLRQQAEGKLGLKDEFAQRAMSREDKRRAAQARTILERPGLRPPEVYNPSDAAGKARHLARFRDAMQAVKGKKTVTDADLVRIARAMTPFLRYLATQEEPPNALTVFPGEHIGVTLQSYCMDRHAPGPHAGEKLQLVSTGKLIDPEGRELYGALMEYSARHTENRSAVQNLVWGMRHADEQTPFVRTLAPNQRAMLDKVRPGMAAQWSAYVERQQAKGQRDRLKRELYQRELYQRALAQVEAKSGQRLPPPSSSGYAVTDVRSALSALTRLTPEGEMTPDSEYTLLTPGVAARAVAGGISPVKLELANGGCDPFTFNGADFAGQSTRYSQRLALGGILTFEPLSAQLAVRQPAGTLFHPPWERAAFQALRGQIQRSIVAGTLSAGGQALGQRLMMVPNPWFIAAGVATYTASRYLPPLLVSIHLAEEAPPPDRARPGAAAGAEAGRAIATASGGPCKPEDPDEDPEDGGEGRDKIKIGEKELQDVIEKHTEGGTQNTPDKSTFKKGIDIRRLIQEAERESPVKQPNGRMRRTVTADREIGIDLNGKPTRTYTVITNPDGSLVTAHPGLPRVF
jgi:hypothetical protein